MDIFEKFLQYNDDYKCEYDCGDGAYMRLFEDVSEDDFNAYEKKLLESGFKIYDKNIISNNIYTNINNGEIEVNLCYSSWDKLMRVTADAEISRYNTSEYKGEKKNDTVVYMFETDHSLIDCGMCFIIRCSDGSFFIIDSAHFYSMHDNDRIHDFLRSLTPKGERIRISGWFVSHGHVDHFMQVSNYLKYNMSDTDIECVYHNLVPSKHRDDTDWDKADLNFMNNFKELIKSHTEIPKVKLHTGEVFRVRNLTFTVLCTHEDVYPGSLENFNDTSTVLMLEAEGSKVLFPGDAGGEESKILENRYGKDLKCDIVQVAHHGHFGTTENFYRLACADVALFATSYIKFSEELEHYNANKVAIEVSKEHFVSADGTVGFTLPYKVGSAIKYPDETFENFEGVYHLWNYEYTDEYKDELYKRYLSHGGKPIK